MISLGWWLLWCLQLAPVTPSLGVDLRAGMQLVYQASDSVPQAPWQVDLVATGLSLRGEADCARVVIRRSAHGADDTRLCLSNDTIFAWSSTRNAWAIQRPAGPGMTIVLPRASGDTVRYETGVGADETISGIRLRVIATTVTTVDSLGRPKRRLREQYARSLTTATGGEFAVPDSTQPSGWRIEQSFKLIEIRP